MDFLGQWSQEFYHKNYVNEKRLLFFFQNRAYFFTEILLFTQNLLSAILLFVKCMFISSNQWV